MIYEIQLLYSFVNTWYFQTFQNCIFVCNSPCVHYTSIKSYKIKPTIKLMVIVSNAETLKISNLLEVLLITDKNPINWMLPYLIDVQ